MKTSLGQFSLKYIGPKIWSNVPENLKSSLYSFDLTLFITFITACKTSSIKTWFMLATGLADNLTQVVFCQPLMIQHVRTRLLNCKSWNFWCFYIFLDMKSTCDLWCYCISSCWIPVISWFESQKCMNKPYHTTKTMSAIFHLNKEESKCELKINCSNETQPFYSDLKYLGITVDRSHTHRRHLSS